MRLHEFDLTVPRGSRGPEWADLQKALSLLGYDLKQFGIDGSSGPITSAAIKNFERDHKLTINGSPDAEMINLLNKILKDKGIDLAKSTEADINQNAGVMNVRHRPSTGKTSNTAKYAIRYFISKGYTPAQAAGIIGNLKVESGIDLNHTLTGDGGKAYGLAQWHPNRQANFRRVFKKDIRQSTLDEQLAFIHWELQNTERRAGQMLSTARTPEAAARIFDKYYERSNGQHIGRRVAYAKAANLTFT